MLTMFQRIVPVPLEAARMATCVRELEKFSESIPLDITEPHVVHQYLCEHVFHERLPTPIQGPEGDRLTKYGGKLITLRALRDQLLADMDDLVAYVLSPAAEGFRLRAKERLANSSAEWTSSNTSTRGVDRSPSQSFDEQITAVKNHNSNRIQLQSQGETSFAMDIPVNQRRDLKPKATIQEVVTQQNIYVDRYGSPEKNQEGGFEEADTMRKAYVERLRASTVSRAQGHRKMHFRPPQLPISPQLGSKIFRVPIIAARLTLLMPNRSAPPHRTPAVSLALTRTPDKLSLSLSSHPACLHNINMMHILVLYLPHLGIMVRCHKFSSHGPSSSGHFNSKPPLFDTLPSQLVSL